jgi:hypothetical protein
MARIRYDVTERQLGGQLGAKPPRFRLVEGGNTVLWDAIEACAKITKHHLDARNAQIFKVRPGYNVQEKIPNS